MAGEPQFATEEITLGQALRAASVAEANIESITHKITMSNLSDPSDLSDPAFIESYTRISSFSIEIGRYFQDLLMSTMELEKQAPELLDRKFLAKIMVDERYTPQDKILFTHLFKLSSGGEELNRYLNNGEVPEPAKDTVSKIIECIKIIAGLFAKAVSDGILKPVR